MLCTVFTVISSLAPQGHARCETKLLSGLTPGALVFKHRCIIFPCWHFIGPLKFVFLMPHFHPLDDISISGQSRPLQRLLLSHGRFSTLHSSVLVALSAPPPQPGVLVFMTLQAQFVSLVSCVQVSLSPGHFLLLAAVWGWWNWVIVPWLTRVQGVHFASQVLCVLQAFAFVFNHNGAFRFQVTSILWFLQFQHTHLCQHSNFIAFATHSAAVLVVLLHLIYLLLNPNPTEFLSKANQPQFLP